MSVYGGLERHSPAWIITAAPQRREQ